MIFPGQTNSSVPINDRAFNFGDGCFTTIAITDGHCEFISLHIERLKRACTILNIGFNDWHNLQNSVAAHSQHISSGVLKVVISRGSGGRGYSPAGAEQPIVVVSAHPLPNHYADWQKHGINTGLSQVSLAKQSRLAGIKHLNRLEQVSIKQELETTSFDDLLVTDSQGFLVESSAGNLFWRKGRIWYTPDLSVCGVEGVVKSVLLQGLAQRADACYQIRSKPQVLHEADEVFVCNCLMKIVPVRTFTSQEGKSTEYNIEQSQELAQWLVSRANDKH